MSLVPIPFLKYSGDIKAFIFYFPQQLQNPSHTYSANGNYLIKLKVTDIKTRCATNAQDTYNILLSGVDDESLSKKILITPNPVITFLQLKTENWMAEQLDDYPFSIFDMLGSKMIDGITKNHQIDVSLLKVGIYILKTEYGTARFAKL